VITIYINADKGSAPENALILDSPEGYCACRQAVREVLMTGGDLHLYVVSSICSRWFWDLEEIPGVSVINADPASLLKAKLQVSSLPSSLEKNPQIIAELGLLTLPVDSPVSEAEGWIVRSLLGEVWLPCEPSFGHLHRVAEWHLAHGAEADGLHSYLTLVMASQKEEWLKAGSGRLKRAYQSFFENPHQAAVTLSVSQSLRSYDRSLLEDWLAREKLFEPRVLWILEHMADLPLPPDTADRISARAQPYWKGRFATEGFNPSEHLQEMSGLLGGELETVAHYLEAHPDECDAPLLERIRAKFRELPDTNAVISALKAKMPPKMPDEPVRDWPVEAWLEWVVDQYIPYRAWTITNLTEDAYLWRICSEYENWLYQSYPALLKEVQPLVIGTHKVVRGLLQHGAKVLWVLVDNLSLLWSDDLLDALCVKGLQPATGVAYQISMLPSETSISRSSAILGLLPREHPESSDTRDVFVQHWRDRGVSACVLQNLADLPQAVSDGFDLYLYIYSGLDHVAHAPEHELDEDRKGHIRYRVNSLSEQVTKASAVLATLGETRIVISSDHGATHLGKTARPLSVPSSAIESDPYLSHRRFVRVDKLESLNDAEWFRLSAFEFGLPYDMVVPRGFGYIGQKPKGFTHGGLLPEETVVPLFVLEPGVMPTEEALEFRGTSGPLIRGRPQDLELSVRNKLPVDITKLEVFAADCGGYWRTDLVSADTEIPVGPSSVTLPAKMPAERGVGHIGLTATFRAGGVACSVITDLIVAVRELYTTELDDLGAMFNGS